MIYLSAIKKTFLCMSIIFELFLFGCASIKGPVYSPTIPFEDKAIVYFYRPSRLAGSALSVSMIFPNNSHRWEMINRGYFPLIVDPEIITVSAIGPRGAKPVMITMNVKKGEVRYVTVKIPIIIDLFFAPPLPAEMEEVSETQGKEEITQCTLVFPVNQNN
jgi:hypothetical protein